MEESAWPLYECLKECMFIRRDLFPPDSKFIQIFVTGTCKFIQGYASSCSNYASLILLFLLFPVQRVLR